VAVAADVVVAAASDVAAVAAEAAVVPVAAAGAFSLAAVAFSGAAVVSEAAAHRGASAAFADPRRALPGIRKERLRLCPGGVRETAGVHYAAQRRCHLAAAPGVVLSGHADWRV